MLSVLSCNCMRAAFWLAPWLAAVLAAAQEPATSPASPETPDAQVLRQKIELLRATPLANPEVQQAVLDLYAQALTYCEEAEQWAKQAAGYTQALETGPQELAQLRAELAKPFAPPKPVIAPDETAERLAQRLANRQAELKVAQERLQQLEERLRGRTERRKKLTEELAEANRRLAKVNESLSAVAKSEEPPELRAAREVMLRAQQASLRAQLDALEQEGLSYDIRGDLLIARRDVAAREIASLESLIRGLEEVLRERRRLEAEAQAAEAERMRREAIRAHPVVREVAEENARLARLRTESNLPDQIASLARSLDERKAELSALEASFQRIRAQIETVGLTPAIGQRLRVLRTQFADVRPLIRESLSLQEKIAEASAAVLAFSDQLGDLAALDVVVAKQMSRLAGVKDAAEHDEIRAALVELFSQRRQILAALKSDYETYSVRLIDLDAVLRQLTAKTREFREYVDQRILWVRSAAPPRIDSLRSAWRAAYEQLLTASAWLTVAREAWQGAKEHTPTAFALLSLMLVLLLSRPWLSRRIVQAGEIAQKRSTQSFTPTAQAVLLTALYVMPMPLLAWTASGMLTANRVSSELGFALARGLQALGWLLLLSGGLGQVCRLNGLGVAHFGWPEPSAEALRRAARTLKYIGGPLLLVWLVLNHLPEAWNLVPLVQIVFALFQIVLLVTAIRLLTGRRSIIRWLPAVQNSGSTWWRVVLRPLCLVVPLLLGGLSIAGYHYTAARLFDGLALTTGVGLAVFFGYLLALRWLLLGQRRLALAQARRRREAAQKAAQAGMTEAQPAAVEPAVDLSTVSAQARSLAGNVALLLLIVGLWYTWNETLPGLAFLKHVTLWTTTQQVSQTVTGPEGPSTVRTVEQLTEITLANLAAALATVILAMILARNVPGLLEITVLHRLPLGAGERYAITAVTRYLLIVVGVIVAFAALGIGWSKVQWLVAAATVGLGFGLQEIFANFVSGLIIFLERPVRVGDIVTVGGVEGMVTRIRIRATTIQDWDRRELLVPNREFITSQLINWTLSDPVTRIVIPVGIAYGSDTELAHRLLLDIARRCQHVLANPEPRVVFRSFGDSALLFELRVFIPSREHWPQVVSDLHFMIDREFRNANIEIAFPQRDIHIRSIRAALPICHEESSPTPPASPEAADRIISEQRAET